jgi:hypothetical protein
MRPLVAPPPVLRCQCGGELRLKQVESVDGEPGRQCETFACLNCGRERKFAVSPDPYVPASAYRRSATG